MKIDMTPRKALSIIKEANPLYYTRKTSGETVIKPDREFLEAVDAIEGRLASIDAAENGLGIGLDIAFKAMSQGVFYVSKGTVLYCDKPKLMANVTYSHYPDGSWSQEANSYSFIVNKKGLCVLTFQYGKTWALTKEELEETDDD